MATTRIIPHHIGTGKNILNSIKDSLDYGKNPNKTRNGELISFYECNPITAHYEFLLSKKQYNFITGKIQDKEHDIILYQLRQSFKPETISAENANRLGYELAMRFTKGKHAFIVATHEDRKHIHSHIYFNSTNLDGTKKFKNFLGSTYAIRKLSDQICVENGLSIIKNPKPSKDHYGTWLGSKKKLSNRDILRRDIDTIISQNPKDFEEFLDLIKSIGYTIKQKKFLTFENPKFKKAIRCDSLKDNYTEENIRNRIKEKQTDKSFDCIIYEPFKVNLLVDIENSIKAKNSHGYEQWAKTFNLKQAAQTLIYLQENDIDEYSKLDKKVIETKDLYYELVKEIKSIEKRLIEIKDLEKYIGNYGKTKNVYSEYCKSGYNKKIFEEYKEKIILHEAAKKAFDTIGLKKLPSINTLKTEYATLKSKKSKLYNEYQKIKSKIKKLSIVKTNTDRLLAYSKDEKDIKKNLYL